MDNAVAEHLGLDGVVAGHSAISEVDPVQERLIYRGYNAKDLAENSTYEETAYLLLYGKLPTPSQLSKFRKDLLKFRKLPKETFDLLKRIPKKTHPMDTLRTVVSFLGNHDPDAADSSHDANILKAVRLTAQLPVVISAAYRISQGKKVVAPNPKLNHAENFLYMVTNQKPEPKAAKLFDVTQILYAEHGFNASTFAARVTASTLSDVYSAVTSAVGTLKGPLHGGANEEAIKMLLEIGKPERAESWVRAALAQKRKIMGFGHRVYKKGDTRVPILKPLVRELAHEWGETTLLEVADIVERIMVTEKAIHPNVDYPTALAYHLMDLPKELYTSIFAMSRIAGWAAHIIEQLDNNRLIRPECKYVGPENLSYVPIEQRG